MSHVNTQMHSVLVRLGMTDLRDKGKERLCLKPILNWANICFAKHSSEYSSNFTLFLN